jgi:hypothetical protein
MASALAHRRRGDKRHSSGLHQVGAVRAWRPVAAGARRSPKGEPAPLSSATASVAHGHLQVVDVVAAAVGGLRRVGRQHHVGGPAQGAPSAVSASSGIETLA